MGYINSRCSSLFKNSIFRIQIFELQDKKIAESREFYESLVTQFPTCGKFWKIYIEAEVIFL
jgi:hypothetical protein